MFLYINFSVYRVPHFILPLPIVGHLDGFTFWHIMMVLLWTFLCIHLCPQLGLFPWNKFLAVESLSPPSLPTSLLPGADPWCHCGQHPPISLVKCPNFPLMEVSRGTWHIPHPSRLLPEHGANDHLWAWWSSPRFVSFLPGIYDGDRGLQWTPCSPAKTSLRKGREAV